MTASEGERKVFLKGEQDIEDKYITLGNPNFELTLKAEGGRGGQGGHGGKGGNGASGSS